MKTDISVKGLARLCCALSVARQKEKKALQTAFKVEGHRLKKVLQEELKASKPGGKRLKSLSMISTHLKGKRNTPFARLVGAIRYNESYDGNTIKVGWTGPMVKRSIKRMAIQAQEGGTRSVSDTQRRFFIHASLRLGAAGRVTGYRLKRKMMEKSRLKIMVFFLKKSTTKMETPARPVIAPFWQAHKNEAWENIRNNYLRKRQGERI